VYELDTKTVIPVRLRHFYGLPCYAANAGYTSGAFSSSTPWLSTLDGITVNQNFSNPFPSGYNFFTGSADGLLAQIGQGLSGGWPSGNALSLCTTSSGM